MMKPLVQIGDLVEIKNEYTGQFEGMIAEIIEISNNSSSITYYINIPGVNDFFPVYEHEFKPIFTI